MHDACREVKKGWGVHVEKETVGEERVGGRVKRGVGNKRCG